MTKSQQQALYSVPFMKRYGIKPFPIDPNTMDLLGDFMQGLMASVKAGYDASRPIIVAKSDDERIDGYVIDGRHRCYVLGKLQEQKVALPSPFPVSFVDCKDANHLRALIASYEERGMSKASRYAKAHIQQNLKAIVEDKHEELGDGIFDYIRHLGFSNVSMVADVVDDVTGKTRKKRQPPRQQPGGSISNTLPAHLMQGWVSDGVYAKPDDRLDVTVDWQHCCPGCKVPLKIMTDGSGKVLKVEAAPKITK